MAATKTLSAAATETPKAKAASNGAAAKLGKPHAAVLTALLKGPLTRAEIAEKTGIKSGYTSLLGHLDPAKREPGSLSARGYLRVAKPEEEGGAIRWEITAAGKKALEAAAKAAK